ncbi:hypothetical protein JC525_16950 [Alteromonas sp. IB21]|uniref:hypothetical protein n=1 Tax=Alteromonas sp. IB21 TaxID=2779369 RepID=UPI0018E700A4|nr:hypothetical protein [Alteromonas sp. IB21]MBJ2130618.1 hypothetical protein [Alteromonas sp. IB21]
MQLKNLFFTSLLVCLTACSSTRNLESNAPQVETDQPQRFILNDGLQVSLIPPAGFTLTPEHYGFAQPESFSRIKVYEVEVPYKTYTTRITKENMAENKLQWVEQKDVEVASAVCKLTVLKQAIAGTIFDKQLLVCGDNLSSVVVEASYPESANKVHRQAIFDSMITLNVNTDENLRIFTGLPFKLNATPGFKITKRFANSIVLQSLEDNAEESSSDKGIVVISHGTTDATSIDELAINLITKGHPPENIEILTNSASKLDGIPALTTSAYTKNRKGESVWIKQTLSYQNKRFLLFQSRVLQHKQSVFEEQVKALIEQFEFK